MVDEDRPITDEPALSPQFIHLVRTCQQIQMTLSQMADQKASILMGATFVIFTLAIGHSSKHGPPLPMAVLGTFAFFSAVLAMFAVLPAIGGGSGKGEPNLLFFGAFTQLGEAEFIARLRDEVATDPGVFELMARDIYQNGLVLKRKKYRLLGWAYRVFLVGLTLSFAAYLAQIVGWA